MHPASLPTNVPPPPFPPLYEGQGAQKRVILTAVLQETMHQEAVLGAKLGKKSHPLPLPAIQRGAAVQGADGKDAGEGRRWKRSLKSTVQGSSGKKRVVDSL